MKKYEYDVVYKPPGFQAHVYEIWLNDRGQTGWILVSEQASYVIMMREIVDD